MTVLGIIFGIFCIVPALAILATAAARLNDIRRSQKSKRWWVRRLGLMLISVSMMMLISSYFTTGTPYWSQIMRLCGLWGFALTWITTPGMPPWWNWISRNDPKDRVEVET